MKVDYDRVAPTYDERYRAGAPAGIDESLGRLIGGAERVLEVGCGTGHWLAQLASGGGFVCGLDRSRGMLDVARATGLPLVHGDGCALPFRAGSLDAVLCINALHHFPSPPSFVGEAFRVLRSGGSIAVVGMDPSAGLDRWYLYDYFPGTLETDRARYPSALQIAGWMENVGFTGVERGIATRIEGTFRGRDVFSDPILSRHGTSQLSLLGEEEFAAGMARIEGAISAGDEGFVTDLSLALVTANR